MVFSYTDTPSPTGTKGGAPGTADTTAYATALHEENARLRAQLQESRAEATYLANTDWNKLIRALTDNAVGVNRVQETEESDADDGVFCGAELAWWLSNNVQGVW